MTTIQNILESQSLQQPYHSAIIDIEGKSSSYRQLLQQAQYTQAALNARGIEQNDPVVVILPNGPLMAVAFLSVASCAASAPLNPAFPAAEFKFFLEDLKPKAVIIESGSTNV
ncbi:MAG TPA: AMP-binding protein, partial [Brevefilum sp.]|nr:AMP-binding protein [Brevefilum sp.]